MAYSLTYLGTSNPNTIDEAITDTRVVEDRCANIEHVRDYSVSGSETEYHLPGAGRINKVLAAALPAGNTTTANAGKLLYVSDQERVVANIEETVGQPVNLQNLLSLRSWVKVFTVNPATQVIPDQTWTLLPASPFTVSDRQTNFGYIYNFQFSFRNEDAVGSMFKYAVRLRDTTNNQTLAHSIQSVATGIVDFNLQANGSLYIRHTVAQASSNLQLEIWQNSGAARNVYCATGVSGHDYQYISVQEVAVADLATKWPGSLS